MLSGWIDHLLSGVVAALLRSASLLAAQPPDLSAFWTVLRHAEGVRATSEVLEDMEAFFQRIDKAVDFKRGGRECRIREAGLAPDTLGTGLDVLRGLLGDASETVDDEITKARAHVKNMCLVYSKTSVSR